MRMNWKATGVFLIAYTKQHFAVGVLAFTSGTDRKVLLRDLKAPLRALCLHKEPSQPSESTA